MRSMCLLVLCAGLLLAAVASVTAQTGERLDYEWFLNYIGDLDRLPFLEDGVISRQFSSYHRASRYDRETGTCVEMDQNGDAGHRLSVHFGPEAAAEYAAFKIPDDTPRYAFGDLEWVLDPLERNHVFFLPKQGVAEPVTTPPEGIVAAIGGPGCILRIWSANPMGKIRFYFDGSTTPMEFDFKELFLGGVRDPDDEALARRRQWPFIRPMTFRRAGEGENLASDCYLPMPFAESCIITLTHPSFYQFGYKQFPPGTQVATFRLPLSVEEDAALAKTCERFLGRGDIEPREPEAKRQTIERTVELQPGVPVTLAELDGPGIVQAIQAKLTGQERYAHSNVLLTAYFDDEAAPCIWSPIVNFFGTGFSPNDYKSYPLGYIDGEGYCYFPMPFRKSGRFVIENQGRKPAILSYRIAYLPVDELPANAMYFKCKYRREQVCTTFDYPFLECSGAGRFVGTAISIDDAWRSWWGEGDEKIWVDGDVFPSFFGTGSEDFFGDAWGIRTLQETFYACSFIDHNATYARTCCYRWMVPDDVPFHNKFVGTIENYPESIWGTRAVKWDEDYVSVSYWYQMPGGSDFFRPVAVADRRPWGKVPGPPVIEAETAFAAELQRGAKLVSDEELDYELSRGTAIDLGQKAPGDTLSFTGPELELAGPYTIQVHVPRGLDNPAQFDLMGQAEQTTKLGETEQGYGSKEISQVGIGVFPVGRPKLSLRFTSSGPAVFDCITFAAARQLQDVVEAEGAKLIAEEGAKATWDTGVIWSSGKQMRFPATKVGDVVEIEASVPPGNWNLCVGQTRGPAYGNYTVSINGGEPRSLKPGFAARQGVADWVKIGVARGANGPTRLRFECAGKDANATGYSLGLDYIGWQRIVVEDAIEGETADVVDIKDGSRTDQQLGDRFSGGNHLWFHPTKVGASFTWLVDVPEDGKYELAVYFTKSWDYAIVEVSLDGRAVGTFDTYAPTVVWGGKTTLGIFDLKQGQSRLRFEMVGQNEKSKGILVGVDCITLIPQ